MYSTTQKEAEIPDHVLTLYNRAIINCASLPREKLVEAFAEIQGMYPHYPVPYLHWLAEVMSQDQRRNSATRSHHDGKGIDLPDRGAQYDRTGATRPAVGAEAENKPAAN